jgi:hypothetical protein
LTDCRYSRNAWPELLCSCSVDLNHVEGEMKPLPMPEVVPYEAERNSSRSPRSNSSSAYPFPAKDENDFGESPRSSRKLDFPDDDDEVQSSPRGSRRNNFSFSDSNRSESMRLSGDSGRERSGSVGMRSSQRVDEEVGVMSDRRSEMSSSSREGRNFSFDDVNRNASTRVMSGKETVRNSDRINRKGTRKLNPRKNSSDKSSSRNSRSVSWSEDRKDGGLGV